MSDELSGTGPSGDLGTPLSGSNVRPIGSGQKKRGRPRKDPGEQSPAKLAAALLQRNLCDHISGLPSGFSVPFAPTFRVIEPEPGYRLIYIERDDQVLELSNENALRCAILHYLDNVIGDNDAYVWKHRDAMETSLRWRDGAVPIPASEIKSVRWVGETGYTYRRLPWAQGVGPTPTWDMALGSLTNRMSLTAYIGSLFFDESHLHQYLFIHGKGGEGKSAISRVLALVFGQAFASVSPPSSADRFWTYGLIGKRLVVFPDSNSRTFMSSGLFKSLTGGDAIRVEAKGKMGFTARLNTKFIFLSNERPDISSERADLRRLIYCEFPRDYAPTVDPEFEVNLWAEAGCFLSLCMEVYLSLCPKHGPIPIDTDATAAVEALVSTNEEKFEVVFEKHFSLTKDRSQAVAPFQLQEVLGIEFGSRAERLEFVAWLDRKHGVRKISIKCGAIPKHAYVGIMMKARTAASENWPGYLR